MLTLVDVLGTAVIGLALIALVVWLVPRKREP